MNIGEYDRLLDFYINPAFIFFTTNAEKYFRFQIMIKFY